MGGRFSRQKGKRAEREVRDFFRERGWTSNRIPLSGAAQGFKGDVVLEKDGKRLVCEVKCRRDEFKGVYDYLTERGSPAYLANVRRYVAISYHFQDLHLEAKTPILFEHVEMTRDIKKIFGLHKYVKDCDFLVIKIDRHPLIFIRYFGEFPDENKLSLPSR